MAFATWLRPVWIIFLVLIQTILADPICPEDAEPITFSQSAVRLAGENLIYNDTLRFINTTFWRHGENYTACLCSNNVPCDFVNESENFTTLQQQNSTDSNNEDKTATQQTIANAEDKEVNGSGDEKQKEITSNSERERDGATDGVETRTSISTTEISIEAQTAKVLAVTTEDINHEYEYGGETITEEPKTTTKQKTTTQAQKIKTVAAGATLSSLEKINGPVSKVGYFLSFTCLFSLVYTYATIRKIKNYHGQCIFLLCVSLLVQYTAMLVTGLVDSPNGFICTVFGLISYYFSLAAFFWLSAKSLECFMVLGLNSPTFRAIPITTKQKYLSVVCWLCPALMTLIVAILTGQEGVLSTGIANSCVITRTGEGAILYYLGPVLLLMLGNSACFVLSLCNIKNRDRRTLRVAKEIRRFTIYSKLFIGLGIFWLLEFIAWVCKGNETLVSTSLIVNSFKGVMVLIFCIFTDQRARRTFNQIARKPRNSLEVVSDNDTDDVENACEFKNMKMMKTIPEEQEDNGVALITQRNHTSSHDLISIPDDDDNNEAEMNHESNEATEARQLLENTEKQEEEDLPQKSSMENVNSGPDNADEKKLEKEADPPPPDQEEPEIEAHDETKNVSEEKKPEEGEQENTINEVGKTTGQEGDVPKVNGDSGDVLTIPNVEAGSKDEGEKVEESLEDKVTEL